MWSLCGINTVNWPVVWAPESKVTGFGIVDSFGNTILSVTFGFKLHGSTGNVI